MNKYIGTSCPFCEQSFTEEDDIVVCPDCGTPFHRACYQKSGRCYYHNEHKNGFVWAPPAPNIPEAERVECPNCHAVNHKNQPYCTTCNTKLQQESGPSIPLPHMRGQESTTNAGQPMKEGWTIAGVTSKELAAYMGSNADYFLSRFRVLMTSPFQGSWNFSAFFFTYFYFFYRKMYKIGFALLLLSLMLMFPTLVYTAENFKMMAPQLLGFTVPYNAELMNNMYNLAYNFRIFTFMIRLCCGLFANKLILRSAIQNITAIRAKMGEKTDNRTYLSYLFFKGSPSRWAVVILFGVLTLAYFAFAGYLAAVVVPYMV